MHIKLCAFEVFVFMDKAVCNSAVHSEPHCLKKEEFGSASFVFCSFTTDAGLCHILLARSNHGAIGLMYGRDEK